MPVAASVPVARGHSGKLPLGRRVVIPGDNPTNALASATGFVSTGRDLVHWFAQLDPAAEESVLTVASRREMIRRQWRYPHSSLERYYGLGIMSGSNGAPLGTYYVLNSTNLVLPLVNWARVATNQFDASGGFIFTNKIGAGTLPSFYRLQQ
jgi:hypothetical protein